MSGVAGRRGRTIRAVALTCLLLGFASACTQLRTWRQSAEDDARATGDSFYVFTPDALQRASDDSARGAELHGGAFDLMQTVIGQPIGWAWRESETSELEIWALIDEQYSTPSDVWNDGFVDIVLFDLNLDVAQFLNHAANEAEARGAVLTVLFQVIEQPQ